MREVIERRIATAGVVLAVRDWPGDGPAVVALHGLASNARWWDLVAAGLAPRRVVAVDLRGHGLSGRPAGGYDIGSVTDDVVSLCRALELKRVAVAGHSWGASVALAVAGRLGDQCIGCICVDGGLSTLSDHFGQTWPEAEERMRPPAMSGLTEATVRRWAGAMSISEGSDAGTAATILLGNFEAGDDGHLRPRLDLDRHMQIARDLYHLDAEALIRALPCPLLMMPAADPAAPPAAKLAAVSRVLALLGSRAQVAWIDGDHDLPVQRPTEVAAAIAGFLTGVSAA